MVVELAEQPDLRRRFFDHIASSGASARLILYDPDSEIDVTGQPPMRRTRPVGR